MHVFVSMRFSREKLHGMLRALPGADIRSSMGDDLDHGIDPGRIAAPDFLITPRAAGAQCSAFVPDSAKWAHNVAPTG